MSRSYAVIKLRVAVDCILNACSFGHVQVATIGVMMNFAEINSKIGDLAVPLDVVTQNHGAN